MAHRVDVNLRKQQPFAATQNWVSVKYHTSIIIEESKLLDENIKIELCLTKDCVLKGEAQCMKVHDVPETLQTSAEIQLINKTIFDLI